MIKIGIIGSCITRDAFNSAHVHNWKNYFEVVAYQSQISIPSLVSEPVIFDENNVVYKNMDNFAVNQINTELNKNILNELKNNSPDYLIIDFYGDLFFGVVKDLNGGYITNKRWLYSRTNAFTDNIEEGQSLSFENNFKAYFELWKLSIDKLFVNTLSSLNSTVILHKSKFKSNYTDENEYKEIKDIIGIEKDTVFLNYIWDEMINYITNKYKNVYVIDQSHGNYDLDPNHIWGAHYVHFEKKYYIDFKNKLLKFIIGNELSEKEKAQSNSKIFELQNDDWLKRDNSINHNEIHLFNEGSNEYLFKQNPSKSIDIDYKSNIYISFDLLIGSKVKLDDNRILAIRTFNKIDQFKQKDANQYTYYHINEHIQDEWFTVNIKFEPLDGLYLKVIPILFKNGDLHYKNFKIKVEGYPS